MIRHIVFDVGGVLVGFDSPAPAAAFAPVRGGGAAAPGDVRGNGQAQHGPERRHPHAARWTGMHGCQYRGRTGPVADELRRLGVPV